MSAKRKLGLGIILAILVVAGGGGAVALQRLHKPEGEIPAIQVKRGELDLNVYTTGALRPARVVVLTAPPVGGGTLQIVRLAKTGTPVKAGDVLIEFDPSEQEYNLEQNRSELLQAEQEITKAKADAAVQAAQDQVALLKAKFDVRQAELDVSKNELVSAIDAKKNLLKLEEAKRVLAQLEQDIKSHAASNRAAIAVSEEKQNKARLAMQQAQRNIENMRVHSPIDGLVEVRPNRGDMYGGIVFSGMVLPDYREGDQVYPGSPVAQVFDTEQMELQGRVNESDRANLKSGQAVKLLIDALPGETFGGRVKTVAGMASINMWGGDSIRKFDATFQLDKADSRLRPGFTGQLTILSGEVKDALYLPRQAVFEKDGKPVVYVKTGHQFEPRQLKIKYRTESRVAIEGLSEGTEVALVNPEQQAKNAQKTSAPLGPALGGGH